MNKNKVWDEENQRKGKWGKKEQKKLEKQITYTNYFYKQMLL